MGAQFIFVSRVLNVGGSRRNKHELSPVPVRQARCDIRKSHAWRGKPLSLSASKDRFLTQANKEKRALLKHSHFSTSSFTFRQSTLHPLACTATVRLPSNSSSLSLRRTGRTWTGCPVTARAFKHRLHDSLVGCSATSTERYLKIETGCGHNEPLEQSMTMVELGSGPRHEAITQRPTLPCSRVTPLLHRFGVL